MPGGSDIYDDIIETLDENGDLGDHQFRRYVLLVLVDLGRGRKEIDAIKKKVERLERNSLLLIAKKYPKTSIAGLAFLIFFMITVISRLELWVWIAGLAGVPLP